MSRPRFVLLLVLALTLGGFTTALAQAAPEGEDVAADGTACEAEPCEEPSPTPYDPTPMPPEDNEQPAEDPDEEVVDGEAEETEIEEPVAEPAQAEAPQTEVQAASAAERAALALADTTVDIVDFDYRSGMVTINVGDTVTWTQSGEEPHTVTADDGSFDSGQLDTGGTFSMRFDEAGTFRYYCTLHGGPGGEGMSAVVTVEAAQTSEEPPSVDGEGDEPDVVATTLPASVDGSLPETGGGPPPPWVFALAMVATGVVLWRVGRLAETGDDL